MVVIEGGLKIAFQSQSISDGNSLLEAENIPSILPTVLDKMFWSLILLCSLIDVCLLLSDFE